MKAAALYLIFYLTILSSITYADDGISRFCEDEYDTSVVLSDWAINKNNFCLELRCQKDKKKNEKKLCFKPGTHPNTVEFHENNHVRAPSLMGLYDKWKEIIISPGSKCFEDCKPQEESSLMLLKKRKSGLSLESCRDCLKENNASIESKPYYLKSIDRWLYHGMQCYASCKQEKGDFTSAIKYSQECKECVGMDNHQAKKFSYVLTQKHECLEGNGKNRFVPVDNTVCEKFPNILYTKYKKEKLGMIKSAWSGKIYQCFEVDNDTDGRIYKRKVDLFNCPGVEVDDSSRNTSKDVEREKSNSTSRPHEATSM